jgi:type IV secretory pathway TrbF-like protein
MLETTKQQPEVVAVPGDPATEEAARILAVYQEIARRDGAAQWHTALWFRLACVLAVVLMVCVGLIAVLALKASRVQAFVQPVQLTEEGTMVLVGMPKDLLDYTPAAGQYMDMLAQWVTKRRWKGDEDAMKRTRNDWAWLYRHSCGQASKLLAQEEVKDQPFKPSKILTSLTLASITKTATPESFQVVWQEVSVDKVASALKEQRYIGTFTVGRVRPTTLTDAMDNRLGLCVTGYDIAPAQMEGR